MNADHPTAQQYEVAVQWLDSTMAAGAYGLSAREMMMSALVGRDPKEENFPRDWDDFRRCLNVLNGTPEAPLPGWLWNRAQPILTMYAQHLVGEYAKKPPPTGPTLPIVGEFSRAAAMAGAHTVEESDPDTEKSEPDNEKLRWRVFNALGDKEDDLAIGELEWLLASAQDVLDNWEGGDLASAVTDLGDALSKWEK